jgi:hypothetical protein
MKDDAEFQLREWFRQPLPEEPASLHQRLARVTLDHAPQRRPGLGRSGTLLRWTRATGVGLAAALVVAVAGASLLLVLNGRPQSGPANASASETPVAGSANPSDTAGPTESPSGSPSPTGSPTAYPTGPISLHFKTAGSMARARTQPTVTLLADGRVLVAGGYGVSVLLDSAEVWDPATGKFTETGNMVTARFGATATLLVDGRVLIAGGTGQISPNGGPRDLTEAELYDPQTGTFTSTGSMTTRRVLTTATRLADGRVLIAGGYESGECQASAELYNPATGQFSNTGWMSTCRNEHSATLLPDGRVLIAGGSNADRNLQSIELYDPATGQFSHAAGRLAQGAYPSVVVLRDGRVLIAGGTIGAQPELFDPTTGRSSPTGSFIHARFGQAATLLPNGRVLLAGGANPISDEAGLNEVLASCEIYDPATGKFTSAGSLETARTDATALLLPDGVLILGGRGAPSTYNVLYSTEFAPLTGP